MIRWTGSSARPAARAYGRNSALLPTPSPRPSGERDGVRGFELEITRLLTPAPSSTPQRRGRIRVVLRSCAPGISLTPKLLAIAPDLFQNIVQFFNDANCPVHAREQLLHILPLKFLAFRVAPVILRLLPFERKLLGGADQSALAAGRTHAAPPVSVPEAAATPPLRPAPTSV